MHKLHNHPEIEEKLELDKGHVIIDREDFNILLRKEGQVSMADMIEKDIEELITIKPNKFYTISLNPDANYSFLNKLSSGLYFAYSHEIKEYFNIHKAIEICLEKICDDNYTFSRDCSKSGVRQQNVSDLDPTYMTYLGKGDINTV